MSFNELAVDLNDLILFPPEIYEHDPLPVRGREGRAPVQESLDDYAERLAGEILYSISS